MSNENQVEMIMEAADLMESLQHRKIEILLSIISDLTSILELIGENGDFEGYDDEWLKFVDDRIDTANKIIAIECQPEVLQ